VTRLTDSDRARLVDIGNYLIGKASQIDYSQVWPERPETQTFAQVRRILDGGGRIAFDCAGSVFCIYKWAGLKSPFGPGHPVGEVNSGDAYAYLKNHYMDPGDAHPGALVTYGFAGDEHVCMVLEHDRVNPILFSHGSQIGPLRISLNDETLAHVGQPRTFLDVSSLG
jgi:hypothetical protein